MEEKEISIQEILDALKKRWKIIVSIVLAFTIVAVVMSFWFIKPKYQASTKVFIGKESNEGTSYNQSEVSMYQNLMKTYSEVLKTTNLVGDALKDVDTDFTTSQVINSLTVAPIDGTQILTVKFKSGNAKEAKDILESLMNKFVEYSKELVPNGNVQVVENVEIPSAPVSPNKVKNTAMGFLLGLVLSVGLCIVLEFMDNTFKSKEDVEEDLELPVLGAIPSFNNN